MVETRWGPVPPSDLVAKLEARGQGHLLRFWPDLDDAGRANLVAEVQALDLDRLGRLVTELLGPAERGDPVAAVAADSTQVRPVDVVRLPQTDADRVQHRQDHERGAAMLAAGEVAVVVVAGGQGTRLGFDGPKGTFPIGPVSNASLFQVHAEKMLALMRRHGRTLPFYVMTSPQNHDETVEFWARNDQFRLPHVRFFVQGQMPAVDASSGRILLADRDRLALAPDGHGGTIAALARPGEKGEPSCLDEMRERGIRSVFYFQVDNPMVDLADPAFLGRFREDRAEIGFKVVEKVAPDERVGVVVEINGEPRVIEYSDLDPELAGQREPDGRLRLWAGSIAIHLFDLDFLSRLAAEGGQLPFHRANKKVPFVDETGKKVEPNHPNAVKFEQFIFDALPLAHRWLVLECDRQREFEPLKNATGPESPASVRRRMTDQFAGWLEHAGAKVSRTDEGAVPFGIEISPLYALDAAELRSKLAPGTVIDGPTYLR
jgi:UDP-N-acetylglucosamine/UDP-N-acetylgalactosamine diphosphorylase